MKVITNNTMHFDLKTIKIVRWNWIDDMMSYAFF